MRKRSELLFSTLLVPIDFLALTAAFVIAYILRVKIDARPVANPIAALDFLQISLLVLPVWIIIFALSGLYGLSGLRGRWEEYGKVFLAVSGGVMFLILLDFVWRQPLFPSKAVPVYAYGFGLLFVLLGRSLIRSLQRWLFRFGIGVHRSLVVGSGDIAQRIIHDLTRHGSGYRLLGAVDSARGAAKRLVGVPVYSSWHQAKEVLGERGIDEIIQADSALDQDEILEMVTYATNNHIAYKFVPNQFGVFAAASTLGYMAGIPVMEIRLTPLDGWGRIIKRSFDFLGALFGLIILSPVMLAVALAIRLTDPGPIVFRHARKSRDGEEVKVLKFRTMIWRYCDGPNRPYKSAIETLTAMGRTDLIPEFQRDQKLADDPRVSRLGRFLRKTSLDELPQLFNVLVGDLSLVGPRPIVEAEVERYGDKGASLFALKPGITGLWQASGRSDLSYDERVKLDIFYVENWSLLLDIKIIIKTFISVLRRQGAH